MKYLAFGIATLLGVPMMAASALWSERLRALLLALLVFSTALGDIASINFLSMEDYRGPDRGFEVTMTDLIALALVLSLVFRRGAGVRWLPYNTLWMVLFLALAVVSTLASRHRMLGAFTLAKFVRLYLLYWCTVNCLRTGVPGSYVRGALIAIGLLFTVLALEQKYVQGLYRIRGPFDHSNGVPLYTNLIIAPLLLWSLGDRQLGRLTASVGIVAALGMVFAIVATQSRAGLVLCGGTVLGSLVMANLRAGSRRVSAVSFLVLLAVIAGGVKGADTIIRRFQEAPESSREARDEFNVAARMMARDRLFGVGLNCFSRVLTDQARYHEHVEVMRGEVHAGVAHHIYWLTAAEMGFVALAVFVIILARFMWLAAWKAWRMRTLAGLLLFGHLLGFLALHLGGLLEWGLRVTPVCSMFVTCSALVVALAECGDAMLEPRSRRPRPASV